MKKSKLITKIMLALVMVCLVFALVACGETTGSKGGKGGKGGKNDKPTELTLTDHLTNILNSANGLVTEVKKIPTAKAAYLSLGLGVNYKSGDSEGQYSLGVKGNVKETNPSLDITFKAPKSETNAQGVKTTTQNFEWFRLALKDYNVYLEQPLTAVNTDVDVDAVRMDLSALSPAAGDLMFVAVDAIGNFIKNTQALQTLDLSTMLTSEDGSVEKVIDTFSGVLGVTVKGNTWTIEADIEVWNLIKNFSSSVPVVGNMIPGLLDNLFKAGYPTLRITATKTGDVISNITLGYYFANGDFGEIAIDVSLSTTTEVAISTPDYSQQALHANVTATAAQKNLQAAIDAYLNPNLTKASGNYVGYAMLTASDADGKNAKVSHGIVKDGLAEFDLKEVFEKLGASYEGATAFKANIQDVEETKDEKGNLLSIGKMTFPTIVKFINDKAAAFKNDYLNPKPVVEPVEESKEEKGEGEAVEPDKGLLVKVYEWLGGSLSELTVATASDGTKSYKDPSEQLMMKALKAKIQDYVTFTIDDTVYSGKNAKSNYAETLKNIAKLVGDNDEWILGFDLIDSMKVDGITSVSDFGKFDKWLAGTDFSSVKAWADSLDIPERGEDGYGKYGLFDWNTTTYRGGVVVYNPGENNDLLDLFNTFVKVPHVYTPVVDEQGQPVYDKNGKQKETPSDFKAITVEDIAGWLNDNICKGAKYFGVSTENKTNTQVTKEIVERAIGYKMAGTGDDIISELLMNGLYLQLGSEEGRGIYGFIAVYDTTPVEDENGTVVVEMGGTEYAKVEAEIEFVSNSVETNAKAVESKFDEAVSLNAEVAVDGTVTTTPVLDEEGNETGFIEVSYPNAEQAFDMLLALWDAYVKYGTATK